jgi:hypothetical protein
MFVGVTLPSYYRNGNYSLLLFNPEGKSDLFIRNAVWLLVGHGALSQKTE